MTPRTLEIFAQVGVIDDILAAGLRFDVVDFVERRKDEVLMQMLMDELDSDTSYPFVLNSAPERHRACPLRASGKGPPRCGAL